MKLGYADLSEALKTMELSLKHVKTILYNMLTALHYLHSINIVHRDLNP